MLGTAQGHGRPDSCSCFWRRSEQEMKSNILLCSATEKGQPGSHLALSSGTKIWLWSDVSSGLLALYKVKAHPALKWQCCLCPSLGPALPKLPQGVATPTWAAAVCIKQIPSNHVPMELPKVLSEERTLQYLELFAKVLWELAQRSTGSCVTKQPRLVFSKVRSYLSFPRVSTGLLELSERSCVSLVF